MADADALRSYIRTQTLVESDDLSDAELLTFLNDGIYRVSVRMRWPWLETTGTITTVADQEGYTLPSDYRKLVAIVDNDEKRRLRRVTPDLALEEWGGDPDSDSEASWYYIYGGSIYLLPVPSANDTDRYTIYYVKAPTAMSNGTDTPEWDVEFHHVVADYAIAKVWEYEEDFQKAADAEAKFEAGIELMVDHYLNSEERHPTIYGGGIRPSFGRTNMPWLNDGSLAGL